MTERPCPRPRRRLALLAATLVAPTLALATPLTPPAAGTPDAGATPPSTAAPSAIFDPAGGGMAGYRIYDLAGGGEIDSVGVLGLSDDAVVLGVSVEDRHPQAWTWQPGGEGREVLDGTTLDTKPVAISSNGIVVGTAEGLQDPAGVLKWTPNEDGAYGKPERIAGPAEARAYDVNAAGEVLLHGGGLGARVVDADGNVRVLASPFPAPGPGGSTFFNPRVLNDKGHTAAVTSHDPDGTVVGDEVHQLTLWKGSQPQALPEPENLWDVFAINDNDDVLVRSMHDGFKSEAFLVSNGKVRHIEGPDGYQSSSPVDINDDGTVLAYGSGPKGFTNFIWRDGKALDLNALITDPSWTDLVAHGINDEGQITAEGMHDGIKVPVLLDPVDPVVFIPGAGASKLSTVSGGKEISTKWIGCGEDRTQLSLFPEDGAPPLTAIDALRFESCYGIGSWANAGLDAYGTLLQRLTASGTFREYDAVARPERRTEDGCDLTQEDRHPNLFVMAYDWRRSNVETAKKLEDYLGCVQQFWPGSDIKLLTHSMGSLVGRRYILDHPDSAVTRMVTIGAPWLGAPKLVNVLFTGDFAPQPVNGNATTIQHVVSGFPAAHELMASDLYQTSAGPVVATERGWDVNGDGIATGDYSPAQLRSLVDTVFPRTTPATTANDFHTYGTLSGGQIDWRTDASGVEYSHIVGLQAGQNTTGTVVFTNQQRCDANWHCRTVQVVTRRFVCGDGTVPYTSATRMTPAGDFNAPGAEVRVYQADSTSGAAEHGAEHTGLAANLEVDEDVFELLASNEKLDPEPRPLGSASPNTDSCLGIQTTLAGGSPAIPVDHQRRYVDLLGGEDVVVSDGTASTDPDAGTGGYLAGVTLFPTDRPDAMQLTTPVSTDRSFRVDFTGTGDPVALQVLQGTQTDPVEATRWTDTAVPDGVRARLSLTATGSESLRLDVDGDGDFEQAVTATTKLAGADASDVEAPTVTATKAVAGGTTRYAVSASDSGSGVRRILWSTDGEQFEDYTAPVTAPAGASDLYAFAEDRAGNRSPLATIDLASVPATALTTATIDPAPEDSGWSTRATTVSLEATATDGGGPIQSIEYRLEGATRRDVTRTAGAATSIDIDAVGSTVVRYRAITAGGTPEPERTLVVRIDAGDPSVTVQNPVPNAVVEQLEVLAGTAADDASGVAGVELALRNRDGDWWDGDGWATHEAWLSTTGTTSWSRGSGLPSGADLPTGGYRLQARVTDEAGRVTTTPSRPLTVAPTAGQPVVELPSPVPGSQYTSAVAVNDRGVAVGTTGIGAGGARATRWAGGRTELLAIPDSYDRSQAVAIDEDGTIVGTGSDGTATGALHWAPDGSVDELPGLGGATSNEANGVTAGGDLVVGASGNLPVRWDRGVPFALPVLSGTALGRANDVNEAGTIVGELLLDDGLHAVRWDAGGVVDLGTLGGVDSSARAINAFGTIIGQSRDRGGFLHAVRFDADGPMAIDEGLSASATDALDINDAGAVVGTTTDRRGTTAAFRWTAAEGPQAVTSDPSAAGWTLSAARDVNEHNQMVGVGRREGRTVAFLVSAVHAPVADDLRVGTAKGQAVGIALPGFDPDPTDTVTVEIVDGPAHGSLAGDGLAVTYTPSDRFAGTDTFTYRLSDGDLTSALGTVTITVEGTTSPNDPPIAAIDAPASVTEGSTIELDAAASSDADGEITDIRWDLDGDGQYDDADGPTVAVPTTDDDVLDVGVQVQDDDGDTAVAGASVLITNVVPAITGPADGSATVGQAIEVSGFLSDPGSDTWTATVDFGDGTPIQPATFAGWTYAAGHTFAKAGTMTVATTVCDDDGGCTTRTHQLTVAPVSTPAPTPTPGPGLAASAGRFPWPGTGQATDEVLALLTTRSTTVGVVALDRGGKTPASLTGTAASGSGSYLLGKDRYAVLVGSGTAKVGSAKAFAVEVRVTVVDGPTQDRFWVQVTRIDGTPVPELSFGGTPATGAVLKPSVTGVSPSR